MSWNPYFLDPSKVKRPHNYLHIFMNENWTLTSLSKGFWENIPSMKPLILRNAMLLIWKSYFAHFVSRKLVFIIETTISSKGSCFFISYYRCVLRALLSPVKNIIVGLFLTPIRTTRVTVFHRQSPVLTLNKWLLDTSFFHFLKNILGKHVNNNNYKL